MVTTFRSQILDNLAPHLWESENPVRPGPIQRPNLSDGYESGADERI